MTWCNVGVHASVSLVVTRARYTADATSFDGKTVCGVLDWASDAGVPHLAVIAGQVTPEAREELAVRPGVQVLALTMQYLIGGLVIVETVFAYPGLGQGLVQAVTARDIPTVQGVAILLAAIYIFINIIADLLVVLLVPKLRTSL